MSHPTIAVRRLPLALRPNPSRVLMRPFLPTLPGQSDFHPVDSPRAVKILSRILALSDEQISALLDDVLRDFGDRHQSIREILAERFRQVADYLPADSPISEARQLLIGSYFTNEYSLESAALFNPSLVAHPDQSNVDHGNVRIILSLRATGEGHISSITFRSGFIDREGDVRLDPASRYVAEPRPIPSAVYERPLFLRKLGELGLDIVAYAVVIRRRKVGLVPGGVDSGHDCEQALVRVDGTGVGCKPQRQGCNESGQEYKTGQNGFALDTSVYRSAPPQPVIACAGPVRSRQRSCARAFERREPPGNSC